MKAIINWLFSILLFISSISNAQEIPNHSFEEWIVGIPIGWYGYGIGQSSDSFNGIYAISLQVNGDGAVPILIAGEVVPGINISKRHGIFKGFYKFDPNGNDFLKVDVIMGLNGDVVGIGSAQFSETPASNWIEFSVPITYSSDETPNDALMFLSITNDDGSATYGSDAVVDFVSFGEVTGIEQLSGLTKESVHLKNFPNPFDLSTTISFDIEKSTKVSLGVYNLTGQKVSTILKNELISSGHHEFRFDSMNLLSGLYFYTLSTDDFIVTRKMSCIK
ncbi:MAG: hypothetical protein DRI54_08360 [Bacteroidetes bacterium]|nr:MAG: hypothetical protein DRI54_08360 [Bacteroidota bacterium]